ncbi:MAG TPA: alpha/beta hydrolase-fold protein, partial [Vicinamibacterales bacterium]|nr:alpha/beta hydrolase-fold protein [Vicinamibacterales bacterium]
MRMAAMSAAIVLVVTSSVLAQTPGRGGTPAPPQPNPSAPLYHAKGEQYRIYNFPGTGESIPYRLFVPSTWTPETKLPMLVTLRAGNTVDGPYRAGNDLVKVAEQRGYIVVTPMGYRGLSQPYYGSPYQIARPGAAAPAAGWTAQENERAEQDVLYVIDLVAKEYNVDGSRMYLHGQNPSGSGALYLASKYPARFAAVVVSSAPIVYDVYPFERLKGRVSLLVIHGDQDTTNPIEASQKMAAAAKAAGVDAEYATVPGGTHLEAYL